MKISTRSILRLSGCTLALALLPLPAARAGEPAPAAFVGPLPEASNASLTARAWGLNYYGELGNGTTNQSNTPVPVSGLTGGVTAISGGSYHSLAIVNGAALAWGTNVYGQLGNGSTADSTTPVPVLNLSTGVTSVAAGNSFSLAVRNGAVFAWGFNFNGQLGNGTTTNVSTPFQVDPTDLKNIIQVAAGQSSSYALASDGSLWVWGYNADGELGLGNTNNYTTPQHLLPPGGQFYQLIDSDANGSHAVAILGDTAPGITAVPEPATWLASLGVLGLAATVIRRRRAARVRLA